MAELVSLLLKGGHARLAEALSMRPIFTREDVTAGILLAAAWYAVNRGME